MSYEGPHRRTSRGWPISPWSSAFRKSSPHLLGRARGAGGRLSSAPPRRSSSRWSASASPGEQGYTRRGSAPPDEAGDLPNPLDRSFLDSGRRARAGRGHDRRAQRAALGLSRGWFATRRSICSSRPWRGIAGSPRASTAGTTSRVAQEIVLGVGGVRALSSSGSPSIVYHFNEGHAVFAGLELMRSRARRAHFERAWQRRARRSCSPPTRRSTPATRRKPTSCCEGRRQERPVRTRAGAARRRAVQHDGRRAPAVRPRQRGGRAPRRDRAQDVARVDDAAPIRPSPTASIIACGRTPRIAARRRRRRPALDAARRRCKRELVAESGAASAVARSRSPLVGFARRATGTSAHAALCRTRSASRRCSSAGGCRSSTPARPIHATPAGRRWCARWWQLSRRYPAASSSCPTTIGSSGAAHARVDVWLNTPRRPLEACGTSGMKAAMNGVLNCSVLDGWWAEACVMAQRLGNRPARRPRQRARSSRARRDRHRVGREHRRGGRAIALPDARDRGAADVSGARARLGGGLGRRSGRLRGLMRASIAMAKERFSSDRMVRDYYASLYALAAEPAEPEAANAGRRMSSALS